MYEVEVKVRSDHDAVRERLAELDAESLGSVVQEDTYYDAPHRDFAETDEAVRIRREEGQDGSSTVELTYKGPKIDAESKTREEIEVAVGSGPDVDALLRSLGFEEAAVVRKERDRYRLDGYLVVLDSVDGLGDFVEVEIEAADVGGADADAEDINADGIDAAREGAFDVLERLGLDPDEGIRTSYLGLLLSNVQ